jgi:hypothetical protein
MEYAVAVMLAVWALWILDPVSRMGQRFYLGRLFAYRGPGFWFGLPLGSQVGFAGTAAVLVGLLTWIARREPDRRVDGLRRHPHLAALVTYHVQMFHLAVVAFVLGADAVGGSALLMWIPAALITAVFWSTLADAERESPSFAVAETGGEPISTPKNVSRASLPVP